MQTTHILIQRWFPEGEGWAYDSGLSDDIRTRAVSAISNVACKFTGSVIESNTRLDEYILFVRIEPDIYCLDPKAISRNPHLDIGVLIPDDISGAPQLAAVYIKGAKKVSRRGPQMFDSLTGKSARESQRDYLWGWLIIAVFLAIVCGIGYGVWQSIPLTSRQQFIAQKVNPFITVKPVETPVDVTEPIEPETSVTPAETLPFMETLPSVETPKPDSSTVVDPPAETMVEVPETPESPTDEPIEGASIASAPSPVTLPPLTGMAETEPKTDIIVTPPSKTVDLRDSAETKELQKLRVFSSVTKAMKSKMLNKFIEQINKPRKWLTEKVKKSNHVDVLFLKKFVEHYPSEDIALFDDSSVLKKEYDAKIKEICDAFGVNKFEEIVEKLNSGDFYVYQASGELDDYVNPLPKEAQEWVEDFYNDKPLEYKHKPLYNNVPEEMKEDAVSRLWLVVSANFAYLNMPLTVDEARNLADSKDFNKDFIDKLNEKTAAKQWLFDTNDDLESVLDEVHAIFDLENKRNGAKK